ncbi:hexamerin 70a-like [Halictus rubicundus]|uniref:hexamerin 70a-like n=1 Tax=Halictus rubicundus TaxID=77578 RepID=UPI004035E526
MLRLWLLGLLAVMSVGADANHETFKPTSKFVGKQRQILDLFYHVFQPGTVTSDNYNRVKNLDIYKNQYEFNDPTVVDNYLYLKNISNLQHNELFSIHHPEHLKEVKALYDLFINAKEFSNFYDVATWAKINENEGKFFLALYTAVLNRPDTQHIKLPQVYELYPYLYFNSEVIKAAIDYQTTHRITDKVGNLKPKVIEAKYSGWNVNHEINLLNKVNYFVEDIGLNQFYTYLSLNYPFWLKNNQSIIRGEEYLFTHKYLLNRYNLERLSNGLPFVEDFQWTKPFPISYEPHMIYHNGIPVPQRQALAPYPKSVYHKIRDILNFEARIVAAIDSGNVLTSENKWVNINQPNGLNILGNLIQGNEDSVNKKFYGSVDTLAKKILGYNSDAINEHNVVPSVLETLTATLRDPAFFSIYNKIVGLYYRYKHNQKPYAVEDVIFDSLKINSVDIDELVTYFDSFETNINNGLLSQDISEEKSQLINVKQWRLNHDLFTYNITVDSAIQQKASVSIFLGPKRDVNKKPIELPQGFKHFYQLDKWLVSLNAGENKISRSSDESLFTIPDYVSTKKFLDNLNTDTQLLKKLSGFPQRLLLPKGSTVGQPFQLFVYIKPLKEEVTYKSNIFGDVQFDTTALGFPLDNPIDQLTVSQHNFKLVDVIIKHKIGPADVEISF